MYRLKHIALCLLLLAAIGCGAEQDMLLGACATDDQCSAGTLCLKNTGKCTEVVSKAPDLEVWPPNVNNQGWVSQEYQTPVLGKDGRIQLKLSRALSLEGNVYASDSKGGVVAAQITAWRDSLLPGRPKVQITTATSLKQVDQRAPGSYLLWLTGGQGYTFLVLPTAPNDAVYPPLVVSGLMLADHTKRDFVLEGTDRTVQVKVKVLDATGNPLPHLKVVDPTIKQDPLRPDNNKLSASVRVRAYESGGLHLSTLSKTDPKTGECAFRVPAGGTMPTGGLRYSLRVESVSGGIPVPTVTCDDLVLGIFSGKAPEQTLGDLRLPAFRLPMYYTVKVRGKDGTAEGVAVAGARVKFSMKFSTVPAGNGFTTCSATYERTGITNSEGTVTLPLLPGTDAKNQEYAVTITSPATSPYAGVYQPKVEVGPGNGILAAMVLPPRFKLAGKVVSPDGVAVAGALVEAQGIAPQSGVSTLPTAQSSTRTDSAGLFSLAVEAGSYNFNVRPPQGQGMPNYTIPNKSISGDLSGVVFTLPRARVLAGDVVDPAGKGLSGAKVEVYELVFDTSQTKRAELRASDVTRAGGSFSLLLPE